MVLSVARKMRFSHHFPQNQKAHPPVRRNSAQLPLAQSSIRDGCVERVEREGDGCHAQRHASAGIWQTVPSVCHIPDIDIMGGLCTVRLNHLFLVCFCRLTAHTLRAVWPARLFFRGVPDHPELPVLQGVQCSGLR